MSNCSWLVASDIHGSKELWRSIYLEAKHNSKITAVVLCGDLTNNGKRKCGLPGLADTYPEFLLAKECIGSLAKLRPVYWIPGNHDWEIAEADFAADNVTCVDGKKVVVDGLTVFGVNQSPCFEAPQLADEWRNMSTDPKVDREAYSFAGVDIVISHCPPDGVLDNLGTMHIGSPALVNYVRKHSPKFVFCGHVHDHGGQIAKLGDTVIINTAATFGVYDLSSPILVV